MCIRTLLGSSLKHEGTDYNKVFLMAIVVLELVSVMFVINIYLVMLGDVVWVDR